ncbi:MAG: hypothetical protein ACRDJK_06235, partial [Actinomycetota bacterium]
YMQRREGLSQDQLAGFIMPRTVIGLAVWLLLIALGVGLSGVIFFALYQSRIGSLQQRIADLEASVEKRFNARLAQLEANQAAKGGPGQGAASEAATITALLDKVAPSIAFVQGVEAGGAPYRGPASSCNPTPTRPGCSPAIAWSRGRPLGSVR